MCGSPLHSFLAALPKVELHLHLEGTLSPTQLFTVAQRNNISLPTADLAFCSPSHLQTRYNNFSSLEDFLHYYYIGMSVLLTQQDFEDLAYEYFCKAAADGVVHAEVFFDPQAHTERGIPYATVVEGFTRARRRAEQDFGITTQLIMCFLRHLDQADAMRHYQMAVNEDHFQRGVIGGIGLDSAEVGNPPQKFQQLFHRAGMEGVQRTAHAGEEGDSSYILGALRSLGVSRIDHGIRLAEDEELIRRVAERGVVLTMCPISNVQLRAVQRLSQLPIRTFLDAGVRFNLNSDDPAYFGGYLLDNYCAVDAAFRLSGQEWRRIAEAGVHGAWCGQRRKEEIMETIAECCGRFGF